MLTTLAGGVAYADLEFQGLRRIIAAATLRGPDGIAIVDPGPTTSLPMLERRLREAGASVDEIGRAHV